MKRDIEVKSIANPVDLLVLIEGFISSLYEFKGHKISVFSVAVVGTQP